MYETEAYISSVDSVCILGHDNIPRSERLGLLFPHDIYSIHQGPVVCTCYNCVVCVASPNIIDYSSNYFLLDKN